MIRFTLIAILVLLNCPDKLISGNVDYKLFELDGNPRELHWCGNSRDVVLVVTEVDARGLECIRRTSAKTYRLK